MNLAAALRHLFAALEHARGACERVRAMLREAIARATALAMIDRAAA